jgi:hypothetical protein
MLQIYLGGAMQIEGTEKTPSTNIQAPEKHQTSNSKIDVHVLKFRI